MQTGGGPPVPRPLYGLDSLAARPDAAVIVCEGEKTADAAARLFEDHVAITSQGGANAAAKSDWMPLRGRRVTVWRDNDSNGRRYEADVSNLCTSVGAADVRIVDVPSEFPENWDLADETPAGWDTARLRGLLDAAKPFAPELANGGAANHSVPGDDAEIAHLAALPELAYARERKATAKRLHIPVAALDKAVKLARRPQPESGKGRTLKLLEPELWPDSVNGAELLESLSHAVRRHVVLDGAAADAIALWAVGTFALDAFTIFPRLAITSPEKGCGKTTLLDVLSRLVNRPLACASITAAAVFRTVELARPTLLIDEADTFLPDNEELRGVINSGHRCDGQIVRVVGDEHEPRIFSTWAPAAIAAIGRLPDTLADRSIAIELHRRRPDEPVVPLRLDKTGELDLLARKSARFAADHVHAFGASDPAVPTGIFNRAADNWRPLFAIVDAAGGEWPQRARGAALALIQRAEGEGGSIRVVLLGDIWQCFATDAPLALFSEEIVAYLTALEDRPWPEYRNGKPISANQLARLLKPFAVSPGTIRRDGRTGKGYKRIDFDNAFARYLPAQTVTPSQMQLNRMYSGDFKPSQSILCDGLENAQKPHEIRLCDGVTVQKAEEYECEL